MTTGTGVDFSNCGAGLVGDAFGVGVDFACEVILADWDSVLGEMSLARVAVFGGDCFLPASDGFFGGGDGFAAGPDAFVLLGFLDREGAFVDDVDGLLFVED